MSATDSIITGVFSIGGVLVGILAAGQLDSSRRKQAQIGQVVLYEHQALSMFHGLLNHIGMNICRLSLVFGENLDQKSPNKEELRKLIDNALEAFPFPEPDTLQFPKDDPNGYALIAISKTVVELVREANKSAAELKSGKWDPQTVGGFLVYVDTVADKHNIFNMAKSGYSVFLESLEYVHGKRASKKAKEASVKKFTDDLEMYYKSILDMAASKEEYIKGASDYLRKIGW